MGLRKGCNPMAESQDNWVIGNWVEDLQTRFGSMRIWESMWCFWLIWGCVVWFCPAAFEKYDLHIDCHSGKKIGTINYITLLKGRKYIFLVCGTQIFGGINNTWFQHGKACYDYGFYLFFKFRWRRANVRMVLTSRLDIFQGKVFWIGHFSGHWIAEFSWK